MFLIVYRLQGMEGAENIEAFSHVWIGWLTNGGDRNIMQ